MRKHFALAVISATLSLGQTQQSAADKQTGINSRGDHAMGFSHEKTTHHFLLYPDGGAIEVGANDQKDTVSRDQIRGHLKHIVQMFSGGDFDIPMFVHDQVPPGVPMMNRLASQIKYEFQDTSRGGRVRITTRTPEATTAIHEFLRFQIKDHKTGDSVEITPKAQ